MTGRSGDSFVGKRIREYEVLEELGRGGMGSVYRARHIYLAEDRAIKVVQTRLAGDKHFVEGFIREARILTKLRHPNLVQLHEFGTLEEDTFFMVMEYIDGESVLERIERKKRISIRESLKIIRETALGLHSAHSKGIIHRDISPDNLLLVKNDLGKEITKVIDFGIAKLNLESTYRVTAATLFLGKPEYSSPEQCGDIPDSESIDRRTDIYSLGITLYHMITGKLPFSASTPQAYILKHVNETPKHPSEFSGEVFPELDELVLKMIAKKRENRFTTMEEVVHEIDKINPFEAQTVSDMVAENREISNFLPGDLFASRYRIECKLGEGGMGVVYKAMDKILEAPVALKVVSASIIEGPKTLERFKREVILARRVAHPNVCRIYDIGESRGIHYVSMELLKGRNLADLLEEQSPLTPDVGLSIIRQVLTALKEAHRVGVVHRDLKPKNIMVDQDLKAFITDFGVSISRDLKRITDAGVLIGTPHYMAPEQFEKPDVDHRADIYSIGIIMYEMFTGQVPFNIDSPAAVIFAHLKTTPTKPSVVSPGFPEDLERIILRALEKNPDRRYQAVRDLLYDLDRAYPSSSAQMELENEALVHRLVAEKNYSRAIKYLHALLRNDPNNSKMQRLLQIAISGKAKKDLRRVRSLIEKKNLIQAQLLMERIRKLQPDNQRLLNYIQKLETHLTLKRRDSVETYIREAQECLKSGELEKGVAHLESAAHLDANDPQIPKLAEEFLAAQQKAVQDQEEHTLKKRAVEFSEMLAYGMDFFDNKKWDEAVQCFETLVSKFPDHPEAGQYLDSARGWAARATEVRERLHISYQEVDQFLQHRNWDQAIQSAEYTLQTDYSPFVGEEELIPLQKKLDLARRERTNFALVNAVVKTKMRDYRNAEMFYQRVLDWDPGNTAARAGLDQVREQLQVQAPAPVAPSVTPAPVVTKPVEPKKPHSFFLRLWWIWLAFAVLTGFALRLGIDWWSVPPPPPPPRMTVASINALPWARVRIVPLDSQIEVSNIEKMISFTPCNLLLPEGDYFLKLEDDQNSISKRIKIQSGANNTFDFQMPGYNIDQILKEIGELP